MKQFLIKYRRQLLIVLASGLCAAIFTAIEPGFLSWQTALTIFRQAALIALPALGMTFVMISGGIDLSLGAVLALSGIVTAFACTHGLPPALAILPGLLTGAGLGLCNGLLINRFRLPPVLATIASMGLYRALACALTGGMALEGIPDAYRNLFNGVFSHGAAFPHGIRFYTLLVISLFVLAHILLSGTRTGECLYAAGGGENAEQLSGMNIERTRYIAFLASGLCAALAGMVLLAISGSAEPAAGTGYETAAIAAAAVGGASIGGGRGSAAGTFFGALLLAVLRAGIVAVSLDSFWEYAAEGVLILFAAL